MPQVSAPLRSRLVRSDIFARAGLSKCLRHRQTRLGIFSQGVHQEPVQCLPLDISSAGLTCRFLRAGRLHFSGPPGVVARFLAGPVREPVFRIFFMHGKLGDQPALCGGLPNSAREAPIRLAGLLLLAPVKPLEKDFARDPGGLGSYERVAARSDVGEDAIGEEGVKREGTLGHGCHVNLTG